MNRSFTRSDTARTLVALLGVGWLGAAAPALAQQTKTVQAQIVNGRNNPVPVAVVRDDLTVVLLDQTLSGPSASIDVRAYGRIRVIASNFNTIAACSITPYAQFGESFNDLVALGSPLTPAAFESRTAVYDFPGRTLRMHVSGCTARVVVYGRGD